LSDGKTVSFKKIVYKTGTTKLDLSKRHVRPFRGLFGL